MPEERRPNEFREVDKMVQTAVYRSILIHSALRIESAGLPITFLLGFYVSLVVKRWWEQFSKLPWPDTIAIYLKGLLEGAPGVERVRARVIRRTIIRYLLLAYILCIRRNSSRLSKRFPNMVTLVKTGIIRKDEAMRIGDEESRTMYGSKWWIPIKWAIEVLNTAKREKFITNAPGFSHLLGRLSEFRRGLTEVASYGYLPGTD